MPRLNRALSIVAALACLAALPALAEDQTVFVDQPQGLQSYLITYDGKYVYDDELARLFGELARRYGYGSLVFIFTQCSSGGMLDDLVQALTGSGDVALLAACRHNESAWIASAEDPPGCISGCGLSRPESYYSAVVSSLLADPKPLAMVELAQLAAERDPARPAGAATRARVCPGESRITEPEHPQWAMLGAGGRVRLGQNGEGSLVPEEKRVAILVVGDAELIGMWNDLDRFYGVLLGKGFSPENVLVLAGPGPGNVVKLSDPSGEMFTVPGYVDGAGTRDQVLAAISWAFGHVAPDGQLVFWFTGHGDEGRVIPWQEALRIVPGEKVWDELTSTDHTLSDGTYYDLYAFYGQAGWYLAISLSSQEFDAYLWLYDEERQVIATDDDGGGDTNALIKMRLPADGTYYVLVNAYREGETGAYQLELEAPVKAK